MWELVERLKAQRDDVFFLMMVPKSAMDNEVEQKFLLRYPDRVRLIPYDGGTRDRMREIWTFPTEFADLLHPASKQAWDVDAIVTSRMHQLAMFRYNSARRSSYGRGSMRYIVGMEEMPIFGFSQTVAWHEEEFTDLVSLANYAAADKVAISSFWGKRRVLQSARAWLSPSKARALESQIIEGAPATLERLKLKIGKAPEVTQVVFCGRAVSSGNFQAVAETFRKQFSFPVGKGQMEFSVSTNSAGVSAEKFGDMSMVSIEQNGREAFYEFLDKRATVALNLSQVNDFSMSTYEMLLHGVPVIVYEKDWTDFLGSDYPFRVKTEVEAYAMVNWFAQDYVGAMAAFAKWEGSTWKALTEACVGKSTPDQVADLVLKHEADLQKWIVDGGIGSSYKELMQKLAADTAPGTKLDLDKALRGAKMQAPSDLSYKNVIGRTPIFQMVKQLALLEGFTDTLETGVVMR